MAAFKIKRNDTSPSIQITCQDSNGTAVDVTGASVQFHMRLAGSADGATLKVDAAGSVVSGSSGTVKYDWSASDTNTAGEYECEFEITFGDGTVETFPSSGYDRVIIDEDLG